MLVIFFFNGYSSLFFFLLNTLMATMAYFKAIFDDFDDVEASEVY